MTSPYMRTAASLFLLASLAACQGALQTVGLEKGKQPLPSADEDSLVGNSITQEGRAHLDAGRTGSAMDSFRKAMAVGEPLAPALNGLGVAYARIGRPDLAERYFQQAAAIAPEEPRYRENIARLADARALALQERDQRAQLQSAAALPVAPRTGALERVARGEVRIKTIAPFAAPRAAVHAATDSAPFKPLVRITLGEPVEEKAQPPRVITGRTVIGHRVATISARFRPEIRIAATPRGSVHRFSRGEVRIVTNARPDTAPRFAMAPERSRKELRR